MDRVFLDSLLDRVAGATSAMLFVLCAAFALVIWWRIFFFRPAMLAKDTPAPAPPNMTDEEVKSVVVACAVAVSAVALGYLQRAGGRFGQWGWGSFEYDVLAVTVDTIVVVAIIYSIGQATRSACGLKAIVFFSSLAVVSAASAFAWA